MVLLCNVLCTHARWCTHACVLEYPVCLYVLCVYYEFLLVPCVTSELHLQ